MENSEQGSDASSKGQRVGRRTFVKLIVLFLFIFTYSILGLEWFAYKAKFDLKHNVDLENGLSMP